MDRGGASGGDEAVVQRKTASRPIRLWDLGRLTPQDALNPLLARPPV